MPTKKTQTKTEKTKSKEDEKQNRAIIKCALDIAKRTKAKHLFINVDAITEKLLPTSFPENLQILLATKAEDLAFSSKREIKKLIKLPNLHLSRMGFIKITVLLALSKKDIHPNDGIVFVTGNSKDSGLDTILCFHLGEESELLTGQSISEIPETILPSVFEQTLNLVIEFATKGKEGKPIGTIFVLGDEEKVMQLSKQMIINPFKGYPADERNILNPALKETLREFSSLDGAFVISGEGEVITAGRYLGTAMEGSNLPQGLGSRHIAAAGITALTNAVAIVISESTGDVRIFRNGSIIMEIEKPTHRRGQNNE